MKDVLVIIIILLLLPVLILFIHMMYRRYIRKIQEQTSRDLFGYELKDCKSIPISHSQGLIIDSVIVCNCMNQINSFKKQPTFYYEQYPHGEDVNGYFFVNLDHTHFNELLEDPKSPNNILCKNRLTYYILSNMLKTKNVIYTGFTSVDRFEESEDKYDKYRHYIHNAGKSPYKGTTEIVTAWIKHPEWPMLTVICRIPNKLGLKIPSGVQNIILIEEFMSERELRRYINKNGIHICASKHEGFGHYINEARSTEAVVLYTDAPPMNEFFIDGVTGIAMDAIRDIPVNRGICPSYRVSVESIEKAVYRTLRMSENELREMGKRARKGFIEDDRLFKKHLAAIVN